MLWAALLTGLLSGCAGLGGQPGRVEPIQSTHPAEMEVGEPIDVVVRQDGTILKLTNRTARAFTDFELWLNQAYAARVNSLGVGQTVTLPLGQFFNARGEGFPLGNILAIDKRGTVYQAEWIDRDAEVRRPLLTHESTEQIFGI